MRASEGSRECFQVRVKVEGEESVTSVDRGDDIVASPSACHCSLGKADMRC